MDAESEADFIGLPSTVYADFMTLAATADGLAAAWDAHLRNAFPGASIAELSDFLTGFNYLDMDVFTVHITDCLLRQQTGQFSAFFRQVDAMLVGGDYRTEELTAMGLIEGLQNRLMAAGLNHHTALNAWLLPGTKQFWDDLNDFWEQKK